MGLFIDTEWWGRGGGGLIEQRQREGGGNHEITNKSQNAKPDTWMKTNKDMHPIEETH